MAIDWDGSTQYATVSGACNYTSTAFSFAGWLFADSLSNNPVILSKGLDKVDGYYIQLNGNVSNGLQITTNQSSTNQYTSSNINTVSTGSWFHFGITRNGTTVKIYLSGTEASYGHTDSHTDPASSSRVLTIADYSGGGFKFNGQMAELAAWTTDLSAGEMAILALGYSPLLVRPTSLDAYWPFVNASAVDKAKNGYALTLVSSPAKVDHIRVINNRGRSRIRPASAGGAPPVVSRVGARSHRIPGVAGRR